MPISHENLTAAALRCGASNAAVVRVDEITFRREFRAACEQNTCGKYGRCWSCPPDCGEIDALIARAKSFTYALIFQTIGALEDSYDIEGMQDAAKKHNRLTLALAGELGGLLGDPLVLGAGACGVCERCAKLDGEPCRFPERAVVSLEAHGVDASALAKLAGMNYINGQNTVTFFGGILFR